eukprot:gene11915-13820_t
MYALYYYRVSKIQKELNVGGVDRTMFKEYKREKLSSTLNRLGQTEQLDISVLNYFREAAHADALVAVELYEMGAVSSIVKSFRSGIQTPKRVQAALETVNELLAAKEVKSNLVKSVEDVHTLTDSIVQWLIVVIGSFQRQLDLDASVIEISSSAAQGGVDISALLSADAVAFPVGESIAARSELLAILLGKSLVCLGLLCSGDAVDVPNRITDRGGVSVLVSALNVALAMCSTTYHSVGIGAGAGAGAGKGASAGGKEVSTGLSPEARAVGLKQSALVCKWACWCLFNLTLNHPPSKAVFFHSSGMRPVVDVLKLHPESAHVHRQGLALLFNLIAPDPYAKYSHAQARQMLMANGIVEVIEHAKVAFKKERDIVATTRAMLNIIAVDYS